MVFSPWKKKYPVFFFAYYETARSVSMSNCYQLAYLTEIVENKQQM
jgi:hypothetical protein